MCSEISLILIYICMYVDVHPEHCPISERNFSLVILILILIIGKCSPKSRCMSSKKYDIKKEALISFYNIVCGQFHLLFSKKNIFSREIIYKNNKLLERDLERDLGFFWKHFLRFFDFVQSSKSTSNIPPCGDLVA